MSFTDEVDALADRLSAEFNAVRTEIAGVGGGSEFALEGHLLEAGQTAANVPAGLPVGSLIFRKV